MQFAANICALISDLHVFSFEKWKDIALREYDQTMQTRDILWKGVKHLSHKSILCFVL